MGFKKSKLGIISLLFLSACSVKQYTAPNTGAVAEVLLIDSASSEVAGHGPMFNFFENPIECIGMYGAIPAGKKVNVAADKGFTTWVTRLSGISLCEQAISFLPEGGKLYKIVSTYNPHSDGKQCGLGVFVKTENEVWELERTMKIRETTRPIFQSGSWCKAE